MKHRQGQEKETSDTQMELTGIPDRAKEFIGTAQAGTNCKLVLVSPDDVPYIWDNILPFIELSQTDDKELSPDDFLGSLVSQDMQLWVAIEGKEIIACMISRFADYPQKRVFRIVLLVGKE